MKSIVITGSTRGIGYGLADSFLTRGCQVTVNGRSSSSVEKALSQLTAKHGSERVAGQAGDVTQVGDHQAVWETAVSHFGKVDIWINNAGVGHPMLNVWEMSQEMIDRVVDIDLKGVIFGSQVAIQNMLKQGHGHVYNMEGFGSDGRTRAGLSIYGSTKSAVRFLSKSLTKEVEDTPVKASTLSPGIVITDFITEQYEDDPKGFEESKHIFNALGDKVETVTPWLADNVLANEKSGAHFAWLTPRKLIWRLMMMRFNKRDLFS
ncbi:MAG: SDR family oxidoreductase [Chloroflexota bacterium]